MTVGYVNSCDDYFGLYSSSNNYNNSFGNYSFGNYNMTSPMMNSTYPSIMTPGMYNVPQELWNDPAAMMEYQYDMQNQQQSYMYEQQAEQLSVQNQCRVIAELVSEGKEDEILQNFNELVSSLRTQPQYERCSEQELKALAQNYFLQSTGVSLTDAIKENCKGGFGTGFLNALCMGNADSVSADELIAEINGTEQPSKGKEIIGGALGVLTGICTGGLGFLIGGIIGEH